MKKFVMSLAVVLTAGTVLGQQTEKETSSSEEPYFYEIVERLKTLTAQEQTLKKNYKKGEERVSKPFERWRNFWEPRIGKYGKISTTSKILANIQTENSSNYYCKSEANWTEIGPTSFPMNSSSTQRGIGRLDFVKLHPNYNGTTNRTVFAGGKPGLWMSKNNGDKWVNLNSDHFEVSACSDVAVTQDPSGTEILLAATGVKKISSSELSYRSIGLKRSINGGNTWKTIHLEGTPWTHHSGNTITELAVDPNARNRVYASVNQFSWTPINDYFNNTNVQDHLRGKLFVSEDYGLTWTKIYEGFAIEDLEFKTNNSNYLYLSGHKLVQVRRLGVGNYHLADLTAGLVDTNNASNTWNINNLASWNGHAYRMQVEVTRANPDVLYVYGYFFNNTGAPRRVLWKSTNGGTSFSTKNTNATPGHNWYRGVIEVSHADEDVLLFGGNMSVGARSTNGGTSWNYSALSGVHPDTNDFEISETHPNMVFMANDAGVYRSTDNGMNWQIASEGLGVAEVYDLGMSKRTSATVPDIIQMGLQDVNCMVRDNQANWKHSLGTGGDGMVCIVDPNNPNIVYSEAQNGIVRRSTNGGVSFSGYSVGWGTSGWVTPLKLDPNNSNRLFAGRTDVWVRSGSNQTSLTNTSKPPGKVITALAIAPSNSNVLYAAYETGVPLSSMSSWWHDPNLIMERQLFRSTDGGNTWTDISPRALMKGTHGQISSIEVHSSDPNRIWITYRNYNTRHKVLHSATGGMNDKWANYAQGLPSIPVNEIVMTPTHNNTVKKHDFLYLATDFGVYYRTTNMNQWECFSDGIPNVPVLDLEIDEHQNIIRCATFGRGVWEGGLHPEDRAYNNSLFTVETSCASDGTTTVKVTAKDLRPGVNHWWGLIETSAANATSDAASIQQVGSAVCCSATTATFTGLQQGKFYYIKHGVTSANHGWQETRKYIPKISESIKSEFHFEAANGQVKTSFCANEAIFLNGVASESETQYFMDAWRRPIGSSGNFSHFADYGWTQGTVGLINVRDSFLNGGAHPGEVFVPGYEYQIKIAVANNPCVGWLSALKTFRVNNCLVNNPIADVKNIKMQKSATLTEVTISPNPSTGVFQVAIPEYYLQNAQITVFDIKGRKILTRSASKSGKEQLDLSAYASGMYLLNIQSDNFSKSVKLLKK